MANVHFQNATVFRRKTVGKIQTAENVRISVKNDIADVLSVGVEHFINSYEATEGEVTFYGKTAIKFLYSDGTTVIGSNYNADFNAGVQNDEITSDTKCVFDVVTVDSKVETNANTATLTILLEITAYAYIAQSVSYLADGEEVYLRKESVEVLSGANVENLALVVDEQLCATHTITSVLLAESTLCVCDYTNAEGILHISGDATVRLTYMSEGKIVTDNLPFKFDRELDSSSIPQTAQLKITPFIRATKVRLDIAEDSINTDFTAEINATVRVEYTTTEVIDIVTDAYGANCDFVFQRGSLATTLPCGSAIARKQASYTLPVIDKKAVTAVNVGAVVTKCTSLDKCAQVEGVVYATLLCQGENALESTRLELPFVQTADVDFLYGGCNSNATVTVTDFSLSDSGNVQCTADLCIAVDSVRDVNYGVILSAEEKPFDKTQLPAIEVCLAHKGETLWELAKGLHMSEEDLLAVNPEIKSPLEKDARIVVYNKI